MYHAQCGEDKKLVELLGDKAQGFYIDVGAWEPVNDSVTKYFYDKGWSGINVEPLKVYYDMLVADRPRDINLNCGIGDVGNGSQYDLYVLSTATHGATPESGLSTFNPAYVPLATKRGFVVETVKVPVFTLAEICEQFVPHDTVIDFLKIDAEGYEQQIIQGANWDRWRPTILCIEATLPSSSVPAFEKWDPLVLSVGYNFIEFDNLNRWYRDGRV